MFTPYTPKTPIQRRAYSDCITQPRTQPTRATMARHLNKLRREYGARDAIQFRDWCINLGTYPVKGKLFALVSSITTPAPN